jgi:chemotaxis protein CheZ
MLLKALLRKKISCTTMTEPITKDEAYARLGTITRELHEALTILGNNQLHAIVREIPDARERLSYVGKMTEDAANKVLNLVDEAKPICDDYSKRSVDLGMSLNNLAASDKLNIDQARGLLVQCRKYSEGVAKFAVNQSNVLSDIMMAQDFQDLSGQIIKKVIDIISRTELQLVQLLMDSSPENTQPKAETPAASTQTEDLLGPQTPGAALKQDDVDDLLSSLGF